MKRFLLSVCLLPGLALAQGASEKTKMIQRLLQKAYPIETRAASPAVLDSVYTYQTDEEVLTNKVYYTYDEAGLKKTELRKSSDGQEGAFSVKHKAEYTYTATQGGRSEEVINYHLEEGKWNPIYKSTTVYNQVSPIATYDYYYDKGKWTKIESLVSTAFNADGYPTVMIDSVFRKDGTAKAMRMEATYNKKHNVDSVVFFEKAGEKWMPTQKAKLTYDEAGRQLSQHHEVMRDGKWNFSFLYTYEYDERGNMIREIDEGENYSNPSHIRYQNFYSDNIVTKNDRIDADSPIRIRINNTDKTLYVDLSEEQQATLSIINAGGTIVRRVSVNQTATLPMYDLNGYYIVRIQTSKGVKSEAIIIR